MKTQKDQQLLVLLGFFVFNLYIVCILRREPEKHYCLPKLFDCFMGVHSFSYILRLVSHEQINGNLVSFCAVQL